MTKAIWREGCLLLLRWRCTWRFGRRDNIWQSIQWTEFIFLFLDFVKILNGLLRDRVLIIVVNLLEQITDVFLSLLLIIEKMLHLLKKGIDAYEFEDRAVAEDWVDIIQKCSELRLIFVFIDFFPSSFIVLLAKIFFNIN